MPRISRHKSHRQHHKRKGSVDYCHSSDSDNEGSHSHGPARGNKGKQQDAVKLKSPKQGNKEKINRGSLACVSDERWEGGGENALSLLAYLEKDSKADSDSSCREENHKARRHKSKQVGAPNGFAEIRFCSTSSRRKETLESKDKDRGKDEGGDVRGKTRVKADGDSTGKKEVVDPKKDNSSVNITILAGADAPRALEASTGKESTVATSTQIASSNEEASSQKKGLKSSEWKLQDDLRNLELEKELENRILRRREESGDRDRRRDGERDKEGKLYPLRDSHQRDDRYKAGKHKEDRPRSDRYKDDRQDDHKSRTKRHKEEWHKEDIQRTDKYKDDKQRDEKPKEDRHKDARQKDDRHKETEHRDDKYKDDKSKADKNKEDKLEDKHKEDKHREDRYKDEKLKTDSYRDDKSKDEKYREEKLSRECTVDRCDSKRSRDESRQHRHFKENNYYDSDQENSSYHDDRNPDQNNPHDKDQLSQKPDVSSLQRSHEFKNSPSENECRETSRVCENQESIQERLPADTRGSNVADVAALCNRQKRALDSGPNIGGEQKRIKVMEGGSDLKAASLEQRPSLGRDIQYTEKFEEHSDRSKGAILSTRAKTKRHLDSQTGESPPGSANSSLNTSGCRSPLQVRDRSHSPSSHDRNHHSSYEKMTKRKRLERGFSSPIRLQEEMDRSGNSDRCKPHTGRAVDLRHGDAGVDLKDSYASRGRSRSTDRTCNTKLDKSRTDRFSRAPSGHGGNSRDGGQEEDASGVDPHSKRPFTVSGEGAKTSRHVDEVTSNKSGRSSHNIQNPRSEGFPAQQRTPPFPIRPPSHLPPPPPFRPGIDNPSVLGRLSGGFEEGPCSMDQGRADWNANTTFNRGDIKGGIRNWNPQAQGPGSNNFFIPFQHQPGGHPPGTFHNMGQRHAGPPLFRGLRPPTDMNHSGVPYHMWENGDRNLSHNGVFGWQRHVEDVCGPPVQGSFNAWDGYVEESAMYGRRNWYQFGQGMDNRYWDRSSGTKGHRNDTNTDFSNNESDYQGQYTVEESWGGTQDAQERHKKLKRERSPESIQIKRSAEVSLKVTPKISPSLLSEAKKSKKYACDGIKYYLSKLDISEELAGSDLYNQCITLLGRERNVNSCKANFIPDMPSEDHQIEVNTDAENLISSFDSRRPFFSSLPEKQMQRAMELYKKASKQIQNAATVDISKNVQRTSTDQIDKSLAAVVGSGEEPFLADNEKPLVEMAVELEPENSSLQHEYFNSEVKISHFLDAAPRKDIKIGEEVSETAFKVMDCCDQGKSSYDVDGDVDGGKISKQWNKSILAENMKPSGAGSDDSMGTVVLTGDDNCSFSHLPTVDSCTLLRNAKSSNVAACIGNDAVDSKDDDLEKRDMNCGEDASYSSKIRLMNMPTHACTSCASGAICLRCQSENQPTAEECHNTSIQQSEFLEHTKDSNKEALKFDFVDSKELVSAACIVHILREVSFHVGLPTIRLPHLVEVAIANVT